MKLSVRSRYAVRLLLDLARYSGDGLRNATQLSESTGVPEHYIVQIMSPLRTAGMVESVRGSGGGHRLARPASEITVAEVFQVTEGPPSLVECCATPEVCHRSGDCPTRAIWLRASIALKDKLESYTLEDLKKS